jgi:predicted MFS family arabinose efflux permease
LFVKPITEANSWGREVISIALAIQNLCWGIFAVFAGGLADRFGNLKVVVAGTAVYVLGMALMSNVDSPWLLHTSAGILVGAGVAGTSFGIVLPAMARAVGEDRQQWALGMGTAAGSLGQFAVVPLAQFLIEAYGWVTALNILAASALAMILLAIPLAPYSGRQQAKQQDRGQTVPAALKEALGHRSFRLLVTGFFVCGFHVAFITAHMPAFLTDKGFDPKVGAWSIAIIGFCNVFGAYLSGILSGRLPKRYLLMFIYLGRAVAITSFLLLPFSLITVLVFSAVMGFLWLATVPATSGLVAVMFGTRYMAMLYGIVFLGHQIGSFIGVWLGGWLYDHRGSYDMVWWLGVAFGIMAAIVHWPIREQQAT